MVLEEKQPIVVQPIVEEVKKPKKPILMTDYEIDEAIRREYGYDNERIFTDDEIN